MSKKFLLRDSADHSEDIEHQQKQVNWTLCIICQKDCVERLTDPILTKRKDFGIAYQTLAKNILRMDELNQLPKNVQLDRIDEGEGLEAALVANKAR